MVYLVFAGLNIDGEIMFLDNFEFKEYIEIRINFSTTPSILVVY